MANISFLENLKAFGLTGQEATIYEALLKNGTMSGYEVAKETGISRSNVYSSLAGLVDKGAAYVCNGETPKYVPVDIKSFCENSIRALTQKAKELQKDAPVLKKTTVGYMTINGTRHIMDKIHEMLNRCEMRLYIMAESGIIAKFDEKIDALIAKGLKVVILTDKYEKPGASVYKTKPEPGQIRFITDSSFVLTGTLKETDEDTCLYSDEMNMVAVMKEALANKISLLQIEVNDVIDI